MRHISILFCCFLVLLALPVTAQQDLPTLTDALQAEAVEVVTTTDVFGQSVITAVGLLRNTSESAYADVTLFAEVVDAAGTVIGEGVGFLVNQCGAGLLPGFALQPQTAQRFSVVLELYADGAEIARVDVLPQATAVAPSPALVPEELAGITRISGEEVVQVEWIDERTLRFGVGCDQDVFTALDWYDYALDTATITPTVHPRAAAVTDALLTQLGLADPVLLNRSFLTFSPTSRRILYQDDINTLLSAEPDGSFKRLIWDNLARFSLHGYLWLPEGRFVAYYYGAYGEDVRYFTASVDGQRISASAYDVLPSRIIPGATPDGGKVIIAATVDGVTGYYLKDAFYPANELLFEGDSPGNNFPAPLYGVNAANEAAILLVRLVNEVPTLQCFDMQTRALETLTALPIRLSFDDRAWMWLSPEAGQAALAANGPLGGLWLVDLPLLGGCAARLAG